jgi:hypothetical protein
MPHYRVYSVRHDGHYLGPAQVIVCATDEDAARQASQFVNGCDVELWEGGIRDEVDLIEQVERARVVFRKPLGLAAP